MTSIAEEEENYVRLALLLKGVTPKAVRTYFDREFPPTSLPSTLSTSHKTLLDLKKKKIINQAQWNLLIPKNGVPDSKTFDVTLMICLIRNLTSINSPINGFDSLPLKIETTPGPDLARIKHYRNNLAHHDSITIDTTYFDTAWREISDAVGRFGGQTMYDECQELKVKFLDQSNQEIMLEIKQSLEEIKELRQTIDNLSMEQSKVMEICEDPIRGNIKELIKKQIEDWEKKDKMFVSTRASDYVMERLQDNSCLTLTAPSGVGKSFIARHTALVLKREGYNIIPVYSPTDIRDYYQPGTQTVFIVDDFCGNFTANQQQIENWKQLLPVIKTIISDKCCKIIVSCRLQVYKDDKLNILSPFKSCECNLISDKLGLTSEEKTKIGKTYIGTSVKDIDASSRKWEFFPLLCSLCHRKENVNVKEFFKNPFDVYKLQLDRLSEHGDEGNYKMCSLALCVLFNNQLEEKWFQGTMTNEQRQMLEDICEACEFNSIPKAKLKKALDTLDGTFIIKQNGIYRTVHDKLFDFLTHYFGQKMIECFIDHGDSDLVHEHFICRKSSDDKNSNIEFIIEIPDDNLVSYLERFIKDWSAGKVTAAFNNNNMKVSSFRQQLLQILLRLDKSKQKTLASTKDNVVPEGKCGSGNTPLIWTCYDGYTDMVQWMLHNEVDVDQCRDDKITGLVMASQNGHTDIVKLLLERNPNVELCTKDGCSPLYKSSQQGHTEIIKLLLEKNPNVDLCNKDGNSPLLMAIKGGHTDIVKLLLEKNSNVELCNKNGTSPLLLASQAGHTHIVKVLLEKKPNVDLCDNNGYSPLFLASQEGHTDIEKLLLEKNPNVDLCFKNGCSPLCIASQEGHTDIVKLLLERNPKVGLCDSEDCSPLFKASQQGHTDIAKLLLERNLNVDLCNNDGFTPLMQACICNNTNTVQLLLEHEANINAQSFDGGSALYFSAVNGNLQITELLLENNADCNICIHSKQYISDTLKNYPRKTLCKVKQLLFDSLVRNTSSHGTDYVSKKSVNYAFDVVAGSSPLHIACFIGRINVVRCLLNHNANINMTKEDGTTPLFYASEVGHEDIVRLLLDKGADTLMCRLDGKSSLGIATENGHKSIVVIVTEHMTKEGKKISS